MRTALFVVMGLALATGAYGEITKFDDPESGQEVWRLTHDRALRASANYHNTQCWSYTGRYTCYTNWAGGTSKSAAEVHIVDLATGEDRLVGKGLYPRWANNRNWLFYTHWTGQGASTDTGTQTIRYDLDTGEKLVISHGVEVLGGPDSTDTWVLGCQRYRR